MRRLATLLLCVHSSSMVWPGSPRRVRHLLAVILLTALALRLVILAMTPALGVGIVDEQHYHVLATSLVEGRGFASASGPTSLRPPLYPAFVAGLWELTGTRSLQLVRGMQALLGLATAVLVFALARRLYDERTGLYAAAITAFYPALVVSHSLLLTETLFTGLLTGAALAIVALLQRPRPAIALAGGLLLGLSALTRSVIWPFPLVLAPLVAALAPTTWSRRVACGALLLAGHALVLAPWAIRNTRLQGVPVVVDTMGGMNLRMGNYEYTPHDRIWDAVSLRGERSWIVGIPPHPPGGGEWTEGWKERWARSEALAFMREHPGLTAWRAAIKFGDFWALDRDFIAGVQQGLFRPPTWALLPTAAALTVAFPVVVGLAILGICLTRPADWRSHAVLLLLVLFVAALHSVVFGHPRYRLPLTPVLAVYAGAALSGRAWLRLREGWRRALLPLALAGLLAGIWTAQFVTRDWPYVSRLLGGGAS
jgi:4-amino-4-deoxy-L-arabinose transferase-like glycosyltransferase